MRVGKIPGAAVSVGNFYCNAFEQIFSQMRSCQLENFVAFLFRNETESQFCHRMTGDDCLCLLSLISSAASIDLGCWYSADALERIVAGLAKMFRDACF